jgi:16S rRNA (uracil1498-N3)-methyltransferase
MQRYFGKIIGKQVLLSDEDIHHLTHVMRCKVGDQIEIVYEGMLYLAEVKHFRPIEVDVVRKLRENNELPNRVILIACLIKGEKMDFVLQKATELGVSEIVLMESSRTIVKFKRDDKNAKLTRFRKILKEAAEQSRRTAIPRLDNVFSFSNLKDVEADIKIIAYEGEEGPTTSFNKIVNNIKPGQTVAVLVGPEGGFSEDEVEYAERLKFKKVSLGKRILRAETASIYALSVIANKLENNA